MSGRRGLLAVGLTAAALMAAPAQAGAVTFFRGDFPAGTHPTSVAVGNFNGGAPDLAVANEGSDDVSILLGNGFGQFTAGTPVSVGDAPSSIVTGFFNNDSFADLAIASVGGDNIAIRLGDGNGGFSGIGAVTTGTGSDPRAIATGDFNGDSKTDLVAANNGSSTVSIQLGDGAGGFGVDASPENVAASAASPVAIAPIQLGGTTMTPDNMLDVMIASQASDQVLSLFGDGTGGFGGSGTNYTAMFSATNPNPSAIAVGSLNPTFNTEPDILIANVGSPDFLIPGFGRLDGSAFDFGGSLLTGADPVALAMGDLDGDGDQDGISANSGAANATVVLSDGGGGTSVDTSSPVGSSPRSVATGAFDADAMADVAVANYDSNSVTVLTSLQPGPPATTPPATTPTLTNPAPVQSLRKKCKKKKHRAAVSAKKKCKKKRR
jgi:FG-GAP-like repeat